MALTALTVPFTGIPIEHARRIIGHSGIMEASASTANGAGNVGGVVPDPGQLFWDHDHTSAAYMYGIILYSLYIA